MACLVHRVRMTGVLNMKKAKMQSVVLLAGILLLISWIMAADAEAAKRSSSQSRLASESGPASQPVKLKDAAISPIEKRVVDLLAATSMKLTEAREKARELQPKIEAVIAKAKDSESGQKVIELARIAEAKAQELVSQARKSARAAGAQLEKTAEQTAGRVEGMGTAVSSAKGDVSKIKLQTPTSQPTEAYYRALWHYRMLWAKHVLLKARAICERTAASALKAKDTKQEPHSSSWHRHQRAPPRKRVHERN